MSLSLFTNSVQTAKTETWNFPANCSFQCARTWVTKSGKSPPEDSSALMINNFECRATFLFSVNGLPLALHFFLCLSFYKHHINSCGNNYLLCTYSITPISRRLLCCFHCFLLGGSLVIPTRLSPTERYACVGQGCHLRLGTMLSQYVLHLKLSSLHAKPMSTLNTQKALSKRTATRWPGYRYPEAMTTVHILHRIIKIINAMLRNAITFTF